MLRFHFIALACSVGTGTGTRLPRGIFNATVYVLDGMPAYTYTTHLLPGHHPGTPPIEYSVQLGNTTVNAAGAVAVLAGWLMNASTPPEGSTFSAAALEYNGLAGPFSERCEVQNPAGTTTNWRCEQQGIVTNCNCSVYPAGHELFRAGSMREHCACRRMLELAVGVRQSIGPGQLVVREFSTPAPGRCGATASPNDPCTWRLWSVGRRISAGCAQNGLSKLLQAQRAPNIPVALERALVGAGSATALWNAATASCSAATPHTSLPVGGSAVNTGVRTVTAYRMTPAHLQQALADMDSADLRGDLFFGAFEAQFQCTNRSATSPALYMCRDSPDDEGHAFRQGKAVYIEYNVTANGLHTDYTMCNSRVVGGAYSCVPEWYCSCHHVDGARLAVNASGCACADWGGSYSKGRTDMAGLGEIAVEADWGTHGAGMGQPNCSSLIESKCSDGCEWDAPKGRCVWAYNLAIALSEIADRIQGSWIAVESAGECKEDGNNACYWSAEVTAHANATCVNNLINVAVANNSAVAMQCWEGCGLTPNYPRLPSDCWVRCLQSGVLGPEPRLGDGSSKQVIDPRVLTAAFERGMRTCNSS